MERELTRVWNDDTRVKKYTYGEYIVWLMINGSHVDYYLQHEDYGVLQHMIGFNSDDLKGTIEDFINSNINYDIVYYKEHFED